MDSWWKVRRILERPMMLECQSLIRRSLSSWTTTELRSADPVSPTALEIIGKIQPFRISPLPSPHSPHQARTDADGGDSPGRDRIAPAALEMIGKIQPFRMSPLPSPRSPHQARTDADGGDSPGRDRIAPAALEMFGKIQSFLISPLSSPRSPRLPTSPAKARTNDAGDDPGVEDDGKGSSKELSNKRKKEEDEEETRSESSTSSLGFPPPISTIGKGGKPWVYLKSFKEDGRFVLKRIKVPTQQCLQATRENGRLMLVLYKEERKGSPPGDAQEERREEVDLAGKEDREQL